MALSQDQISELIAAIKAPDPDPQKSRAKPDESVPALRKRLAAAQEEATTYFAKWSENGYVMTTEDDKKAEELTQTQQQARRLLDRAEQWFAADNHLANGNQRISDPILPHNDGRNTHNGRHSYSVMKVLRAIGNRSTLDGIEGEVHEEMNKVRARSNPNKMRASGFNIPLDLPVDLNRSTRWAKRSNVNLRTQTEMAMVRRQLSEERALDTTAGAGSIPTIVDTTLIELLRPRMVTYGLGARVMTDMQGLFAIPRQASAATFYMVTQGSSVTASNQTIDQVPFSPHTGGAYTTYTRQFLEQTNQDAEMFVREDLSAVVARGVETAAFNGQASSGYPLGILENPQIGVYSLGTNGAAPTWTMLITLEAFVAYFNADVGGLAYVTDALTRGTLKLTLKISGGTIPIYLWNTEAPDFPLNGYPCAITNLLPQNIGKGSGTNLHAMTFGNWQDLVYAFWSGLDVIVDPYTSAPQGAVNIIALQDFDVNVRHYQSFANCMDIISSITAPVT
jgi:HK97 family phage major capsid protein